MMARTKGHGLLVILFAAGAVGEVAASLPPASANDDMAVTQNANSQRLAEMLVERGMAKQDADLVVKGLTPSDVEVFVQNPEMLQAAGDSNDAVGAALLVLLILLLLAAAASA